MKVLHLISGLLLVMMTVAACSTDSGSAPSGTSSPSRSGSNRSTGGAMYPSGY